MFKINLFLFFAYGLIIRCDMIFDLLDHLIPGSAVKNCLQKKKDEILIPQSHFSAVDKMNI